MEDKILEFIAWGLVASKYALIWLTVVVGTQFVVYQGSKHKINPIMWVLTQVSRLANVEF